MTDPKYCALWIARGEAEAAEVLAKARRHPHGSAERAQALKEMPGGFEEYREVTFGHVLRLCGLPDDEDVLLGLDVLACSRLRLNSREERARAAAMLESLCTGDRDPRILTRALHRLGVYSVGLDRFPLLRDMLEHADPRVRASAVEGIRSLNHGQKGDDYRGAEELIGLITADPDPEVRRVSIRELRFVETPATERRAWDALMRAARTDPAAQVRAAALDELGELYGYYETPWARENGALLFTVFVEAADDPDANVRCTALGKLGYFIRARVDGALDTVRRHFADPHPEVRATALCAGALVFDEEALRLFRAELADPHVDRAYLDRGAWLDALWEETKIAVYRLIDGRVWAGLPDPEGWSREQREEYLWELTRSIRSRHPWE